MLDSDSASDWDMEFNTKDKGNLKPPLARDNSQLPTGSNTLKIRGLVAKPGDDIEDWDDDFELEGEMLKKGKEEKQLPKNGTLTMSSAKGTLGKQSLRKLTSVVEHEARWLVLIKASIAKYSDLLKFNKTLKPKAEVNLTNEGYYAKKNELQTELSNTKQGSSDKLKMAKLHLELGCLDKKSGFLVEAMQNLQEGILLLDEIGKGNNGLKGRLYLEIGLTAKSMQDILKAINALREGSDATDQSRNKGVYRRLQYELGVCYEETNQRTKAVEFFSNYLNTLPHVNKWTYDQCIKACRSFISMAQFAKELGDTETSKALLRFATMLSQGRNEELYERSAKLLKELSPSINGKLISDPKESKNVMEDTESSFSDWDLDLPIPAKEQTSVSPKTEKLNKTEVTLEESEDWDKDFTNDKIADNAKDSASENESDWDKEFTNDSKKENAPSFILNPNPSIQTSVSQYQLMPEKNFKTIKYPPPTFLFSLRTKENHKLMNEAQLEMWLASLVTKGRQWLQTIVDIKRSTLRQSPVGSSKWIVSHLIYWKKNVNETS